MRTKLLVDPARLLKELHFYNPELDLTGVKAYLFDALVGEDAVEQPAVRAEGQLGYGDSVQATSALEQVVPVRQKPRTLAEAKGLPVPTFEEEAPDEVPFLPAAPQNDSDLLKNLTRMAGPAASFDVQQTYEDAPASQETRTHRTNVGSARTTQGAQAPRTVTSTVKGRIAPPKSAPDSSILSHYESQAGSGRDDGSPGGKRYSDIGF